MPVCIDTHEGIYSHPMGDGLKLMEMGTSSNGGVLTGMALLLAPGGRWAGKRLAVVGDYAEKGDLPEWVDYAENPAYWYAVAHGREYAEWNASGGEGPEPAYEAPFTDQLKMMVSEAFGVTYSGTRGWLKRQQRPDLLLKSYEDTTDDGLFIYNYDKAEYIDPQVFGAGRNMLAIACRQLGPMMGLLVLLAVSNGRGGGDLHNEHRFIGSWACDRIGIVRLSAEALESATDISEILRNVIADADYIESEQFALGRVPEWVRKQASQA